jgi:hypothetical protein
VTILSTQLQQEKLGGFAERRTHYLLEEFQRHLAPADSKRTRLSETSRPILPPSPPIEFGFNVQTITYLNDLLTAVVARSRRSA